MLRFACLPLALVLAGPGSPAAAQGKLHWKFKEGDTFFVEEKTSTRQDIKLAGSRNVQELEQTKVSRFKVLKVQQDGGAVLEQKIESVQATAQGAAKEADVSALQQMQGATFRITLDSRQRVAGVEGYQALVKALTNREPDKARLLRAVLTEDSFRRPLVNLLGFCPDKAAVKGDHWQVKSRAPFGPLGLVDFVDTYSLRGPEEGDKDMVRVGIATAVSYSAPPGGTGLALKVVSGDVKVKESKGHLLFNVASGRLVRRETELTLRAVLTVAIAEQRLDMAVEQRQSSTVRVLEHDPVKK
jgi:hypothetical protein